MLIGKQSITQLTAAGNATSLEMGEFQPASAEVEVTIATIDTNAVVRVDYSNDAFSTTAAKSSTETYTANGVYVIPMAVGYKYARLVFVSESGGTGVTVDAVYKMFN